MTPNPSEAELAELERLEKDATPGPWPFVEAQDGGGEWWACVDVPGDDIAFKRRGNAELVAAARNALPGLLLRIRELTEDMGKLKRNEGALLRQVDYQQARAEAAEKRAEKAEAELSALRQPSRIEAKRPLPPGVLANALQDRIHPASGRLLSASPVVAKPDAAVREALVGLYEAAMLSHVCMGEECRYACPSHLPRITKALAAARAALPELTGKEAP